MAEKTAESHSRQVLEDIRILDFSWVLAGPYATRFLADFGAEVIKVQPLSPGAGDRFSRGYFNNWNRSKLGVTLDPSKPDGKKIAGDLIKKSDVIVENFSPRVMSNWGLDYSEAKKIRPDIIYLSLSIMGHSGPWLHYSGFGPTVQALCGMTGLTSYPDRPPAGIGYSYADHIAGLYGAVAVLAALEYRSRTGQGQDIDLSETEAMISLLCETIVDYTLFGNRKGIESTLFAPEGIYACLGVDKWCAVSVTGETEWQGFKRALKNPLWADDRRFETAKGRKENSYMLDNLIMEWTSRHSAGEVMSVLQREGVPAGVVQSALDLAGDPQLRERGFFHELQHPVLGETITDANPVRLADIPFACRCPSPEGGQDNQYVFGQLLGLNEERLGRLHYNKVI
ncbi:MAG: CoA transferase [Dehalococcoidales bacterium]|nr:CoA transferase [Dehalococcoidales bacterium]